MTTLPTDNDVGKWNTQAYLPGGPLKIDALHRIHYPWFFERQPPAAKLTYCWTTIIPGRPGFIPASILDPKNATQRVTVC